MTVPIHTATINGHPVRFFRSPLERPDFPWHAFDDLTAAGELTRIARRTFRQKLFSDWRHEIRQVVVDGELTTIAPHYVGQVMAEVIDAYRPGFDRAYIEAAMAAANLITAGMPPAEQLAFMLTAYKDGSGSK